MKISVITPTFNSEATIKKTLESVTTQDYENFEHILVDNKSTDRTLEMANVVYQKNPEKLVIISEKDKGIADAFNKGIKRATGDLVFILNSDDYYLDKNVFTRVVNTFSATHADFIYGDMLFIDEIYGNDIRKPLCCSLLKAFPYNHPAFFATKALYEKVGVFREDYRLTMDFEWICRLYESPIKLKFKGEYLKSPPLTAMKSGGASWKMELKSINEIEKALKEHHFWCFEAFIHQNLRRLRIRMKNLFEKFGFTLLVKLWRRQKWK